MIPTFTRSNMNIALHLSYAFFTLLQRGTTCAAAAFRLC
jgi:hypothetical protein